MNAPTPAEERARRRNAVEDAEHSGRMEGLSVDEATGADAVDYIDGRIDAHELVDRTRARYGLTAPAGEDGASPASEADGRMRQQDPRRTR